MKRGTFIRRLAFGLATIGLCMPQIAVATDAKDSPAEAVTPLPQVSAVTDIMLQQGNALVGQVVTADNTAVSGVDVVLYSMNNKLATCKTDQSGHFKFAGLTTGVYEVVAPNGSGAYRVWTERTAPPAAQPVAIIVTQTDVIRGQNGSSQPNSLFSMPVLLTGLIATAIAVPVALNNSGGRRAASP